MPRAVGQPAPQSPLVGLRSHHPLIGECVGLLEQGLTQEAADRLKTAVREASEGSHATLVELRLGLGLVLLRAGDVPAARKILLPLSQLKDKSDLRWRAEVLCAVASRTGKPGKSTASLQTREAWRDALVIAFDEIAARMAAPHKKISAAIETHRWQDVSVALDGIREIQDRAAVFDIDELRLRQADLIADHARALAGEVRDINVAIAQAMNEASDLAGHMTLKFDLNPKHKGYLPAHVVTRYNAVVDDIVAANAAGEKLVTEYAATIGRSAGRIKRDVSVKMSKTRLPAKRPVWTG